MRMGLSRYPVSCSLPHLVSIIPPTHTPRPSAGGKACDSFWGRCVLAVGILTGLELTGSPEPEERTKDWPFVPSPAGSWHFSQRRNADRISSARRVFAVGGTKPGRGATPGAMDRESGATELRPSAKLCAELRPRGKQACPTLHLVKVTVRPSPLHALPILPPRQGMLLEFITTVLILSSLCF